MKLPSIYPDETDRALLVHFFPVKGNQRDGSPPCCASGGKEFSGTGRFPLSEQVRPSTSSPINHSPCSQGCWHSSASGCSHHSNCLEKRTAEGNTALHYSVLHHKPESLKLLLKAKAALHTGAIFKPFNKLCFTQCDFTKQSHLLSPLPQWTLQERQPWILHGGFSTHSVSTWWDDFSLSVNPASVFWSTWKKEKKKKQMEMIPGNNSPCSWVSLTGQGTLSSSGPSVHHL